MALAVVAQMCDVICCHVLSILESYLENKDLGLISTLLYSIEGKLTTLSLVGVPASVLSKGYIICFVHLCLCV